MEITMWFMNPSWKLPDGKGRLPHLINIDLAGLFKGELRDPRRLVCIAAFYR
jgi:hypothetical protein